MKFFSHARAADNFATLKHEWLEARFREVMGGNETVMAGTDDDDVVLCTFHFSVFTAVSVAYLRTVQIEK
jgi:small basic protein